MRRKKSKYRHAIVGKKKYYFYSIEWIDPCGDSGHAEASDVKELKPAKMMTQAYVFDKDKKFVKTKDANEVPSQLLRPFPKGWIYSWYKGNIFPDDMETKKLRKDLKICLFNNSYNSDDDEMPDIEEIKKLW